jgi:hypothetical protein
LGVEEVVDVKERVGVLQAVNWLDEKHLALPDPSSLTVEGRGIHSARRRRLRIAESVAKRGRGQGRHACDLVGRD